jgi:hypothetical protein
MKRLQKFVEHRADGDTIGRIAYAFGPVKLPEATPGFEWQDVSSFNPGDELIKNAGLKEVFRAAIVNGCAVIKAELSWMQKGAAIDNPSHINFNAPAILRKWPSLQNERRGTAAYEILNGTLDECLRMLMTKPVSTHHLYEIHSLPQSPLVTSVLSGENVGELARMRDFL